LIIGYEINTRKNENLNVTQKVKKTEKSPAAMIAQKVSPITTLGLFIGLIAGLVAGLPPLLASAKYKSAIESGDPATYASAANFFPRDFIRAAEISKNLENNGFSSQALAIVVDASKSFPDSYEIWNVFSQLSMATPEQKAQALAQMKRLDPLNPNLK
jgi:hypothetical protein